MLTINGGFQKPVKAWVEGKTIRVEDEHNDCRCPNEFSWSVEVGQDQLTVRNNTDWEYQPRVVRFGGDSRIEVEEQDTRGLRGGRSGQPSAIGPYTALDFSAPVPAEQRGMMLLTVASSMVGVPLTQFAGELGL